jgi:hypothetical protein
MVLVGEGAVGGEGLGSTVMREECAVCSQLNRLETSLFFVSDLADKVSMLHQFQLGVHRMEARRLREKLRQRCSHLTY